MRKTVSLMVLAAIALVACGGGGGDDAFQTPPPSTAPGATVATVTLVTNVPTIPSDGSAPAELSAYVRDANNRFMEGVLVQFSTSSGGLTITQPTTDASGVAKATLSPVDDPSRRTITVTASANGINDSVAIDVTGTQMSLQGPGSLILGQQGTYTVTLTDAGNGPIVGQSVNVTSQRGNTLSAPSVTTDSTGRATFTLTVSNPGDDTITATGVGVAGTLSVAVNSDSFTFTAPAATPTPEVPLGAPGQSVTVRWLQSGVAVNNQPVTFSTTRGTLVGGPTVNTNASGEASIVVQATNAGSATVTAATAGGSTAQIAVEFVATTPAAVDIQPSAFTIGTNETSTITAVVRDASNNLVKNRTVVFTLDDVTGGSLSVGSAVTDSQGRAQTIYQSSSTTSAANGVRVTAEVQGSGPPAISDSVQLTVARREVFISLGTGNTIEEPNAAQYEIEYAIQVTDSNGNGVANVPLTVSILSENYHKGRRVVAGTAWATQITATCPDEDTLFPNTVAHRNGQLDPGEDINGSGRIEAGNIATVTPRNATTDANGFVIVSVLYPQDHSYYLDVVLEARTSVQGTEFARASRFTLPGANSDFNKADTAPPGPVSPFGQSASCTDTL